MTMIADFERKMRTVLMYTANELARETGFVKRERAVTEGAFARAVIPGRLAEPDGTRAQLQMRAGMSGMHSTRQGLDQRFTAKAVVFMRALLEAGMTQVITSEMPAVNLPYFNGVYVTDCTRVVWSGLGIKVGVRLEVQRGGLQVCLTELNRHDQATPLADAELPRGALHLGDLGFFNLKRFKHWSVHGIWWLTRYKIGSTLTGVEGQRLDLKALLVGEAPLCVPVAGGQWSAAGRGLSGRRACTQR